MYLHVISINTLDEKQKKQRGRPMQRNSKNNNASTTKPQKTKNNKSQTSVQKQNQSSIKKVQNQEIKHKKQQPDLPKHGSSDGSTGSNERETKSEEYQERIRKAIEMGSEETKPAYRPSSTASFQSQKNLRARYWSYLFDNFHRAVDEIYSTCENDESIIECKVCHKVDITKIHYVFFIRK